MAAAPPLPRPGTEYGPCLAACEHVDCLRTIKDANSACRLCGERIGYDSYWYQDGEGGMTHQLCRLQEIEENRA